MLVKKDETLRRMEAIDKVLEASGLHRDHACYDDLWMGICNTCGSPLSVPEWLEARDPDDRDMWMIAADLIEFGKECGCTLPISKVITIATQAAMEVAPVEN